MQILKTAPTDAASCCDEMQAGSERDAYIVANGDINPIDDAVQDSFTDDVVSVCTNPFVLLMRKIPRLNHLDVG